MYENENVLYLAEYTDLVDKSFMNMEALNLFYSCQRGSEIDFSNVNIDHYQVIPLAELLESFDLNPINLTYPNDILLLTALHLVREPKISYDEFIDAFHVRFPVGTVCIKDTLFCIDNPRVGKTTNVLVIEEIRPLSVRVRRYHSSAFDPDVYFGRGGPNASSNYIIENLDMNSLYHKNPFLRHAINQQEVDALDYFFPEGSIIIQ